MTTEREWPGTSWKLTAPESFVLLNGPAASGSEAFKLGLMELVARNVVQLETVTRGGTFGRTKQVALLRDGSRANAPREQPLTAIWELYRRCRATLVDGLPTVPVEDLARAAARHYHPLGRYVAEDVLPALEARGFYERRAARILWIFPTTRHQLTVQGDAARAELREWLSVGEGRLAGWVDPYPAQALAYAGAAGAALLLMPGLFPDLRRLRDQSATSTSDGGSSVAWVGASGADDSDGERPDVEPGELQGGGLDVPGIDVSGLALPSFDLGGFDFGSLDLSAFDGLESVMSAIDSSVDAGGGGDSGGGGGDGGGGGGGDGGGGGGGGES